MKICNTHSEKLDAVYRSFSWDEIDTGSPDSVYIYDQVLKSIAKHTSAYLTDCLYHFQDAQARIRLMISDGEYGLVALFSIREMGVDGISFTFSRLDQCGDSREKLASEYKDLFSLAVRIDPYYDKPILALSRANFDSFNGINYDDNDTEEY